MSGDITANVVNASETSSVEINATESIVAETITATGNISSTTGTVEADGNISTGGNITATGNIYTGFLGHPTRIKVLWSDFQTDDDAPGSNLHVYEDSTRPRPDGIVINNTSSEMYASVQIPNGYKVTGYRIYCTSTIECRLYECNVNTTASSEKHSGTTNVTYSGVVSITPASYNFITLYVLTASTSHMIRGAYVTMEKI